MNLTIPESEADLPHDYLQSTISRMAKHGWINRSVETSDRVYIDYSELGHKRMRRLAELAHPFFVRAAVAQSSRFGRLRLFCALMFLQLRASFRVGEIGFGMNLNELNKLLLLAGIYAEKHLGPAHPRHSQTM